MASDVLVLDDPEVLLDGLNRSALELLGLLGPRLKSDSDRQLIEDLRQVIRRTFTIQLLHHHDFIAVTGSQGAGKTTLVSMLYDLGPGFWPPTPGLARACPSLSWRPRDSPPPGAGFYRIAESTKSSLEGLSRWMRLNGSVPSPAGTAPRSSQSLRYRLGSSKAPVGGSCCCRASSERPRKNRFAQTLMREALASAQAAIIVTDRSRLADDTQQRVLEGLKEHVSEPVVAVSKSEPLDEQARWEVAQRAGRGVRDLSRAGRVHECGQQGLGAGTAERPDSADLL